MSRVGNKIINVPEGVTVDIAADNTVTVTGAKGTLVRQFSPVITINKEDNVITVARSSEQKTHKQLHGTTRALLANMIEGVHEGFKKQLEIVGIGYRGQMKGNTLVLNIGYSHQVEIEAEEGVTIETPNNTTIVVSGISKERVGQVAAQIREVRKPEPYKGKGIKYSDEVNGVTLASASSVDMKLENGSNIAAATAVGKAVGEAAIAKNIKKVVFDRGGYVYHGRVKALAEAAREAGLEF